MITPVAVIDGRIFYGTKMGLTEVAVPVQTFVDVRPEYARLVSDLIASGKTPTFEWCSRQQKIVIDYPNDRLVLTAIRENENGQYTPYTEMVEIGKTYGVEVVKSYGTIDDFEKFLASVSELEGAEGYVVRFEDGHMVKVKGAWYISLHRSLDSMKFEKDFIRLILDEKLDDLKGVLPQALASRADHFATDLFHNAHQVGEKVYWVAQEAYDNLSASKKRFALEVVNRPENKPFSSLLFKMWDRIDQREDDLEVGAVKLVLETIRDACSTQTKVDQHRHLFGNIRWSGYAVTEG
jgi:RNA ligase